MRNDSSSVMRLTSWLCITFFAFPIANIHAKDYVIQSGDTLELSVAGAPELRQRIPVNVQGVASFPLVGDVLAAGRTVEDVRLELIKRLNKFVPNPHVTILVTKILSYKIYVIGRVNKPGEFQVGHHTDVLQALSMAGGLTPYASENDIKIIRRNGTDEHVFYFRYGDVQKGKDLKQNMILQRGDVVMVP